MTPEARDLIPYLEQILICVVYILALCDYGRIPTSDPGQTNHRTDLLCLSAVFLALGILCLYLTENGWENMAGFDQLPGLPLLAQAIGLAWIVPAGCHHGNKASVNTSRTWREAVSHDRLKTSLRTTLGLAAWTSILMFFSSGESTGFSTPVSLDNMAAWSRWTSALILLTIAPILEECVFRHYLQYRLAGLFRRSRHSIALSIVCCSMLWGLCHSGMMGSAGLKFIQLFPAGICLGYISVKHGLETSILAHWLFNISIVILILCGLA